MHTGPGYYIFSYNITRTEATLREMHHFSSLAALNKAVKYFTNLKHLLISFFKQMEWSIFVTLNCYDLKYKHSQHCDPILSLLYLFYNDLIFKMT